MFGIKSLEDVCMKINSRRSINDDEKSIPAACCRLLLLFGRGLSKLRYERLPYTLELAFVYDSKNQTDR